MVTRLIADIGATNARFAVLGADGEPGETSVLHGVEYDTAADAIEAYLSTLKGERPDEAAFAIAAPVIGDEITMINSSWRFSLEATRKQFGWTRLIAMNDFKANALGVPHLKPDDFVQIGEGAPVPGATIGVLGPGTGIGVAALVPVKDGWVAVDGEGGHVTLAAMDSREAAIIDILHRQFAHVSAERVLSGPGLVNLYDALCELAGKPAGPLTPDHVTNIYPGCDPQAREAVALFCAMLGTFASDVALTFGARGGIYIMGGIVPKILDIFRRSAFRERFEMKGRYRFYLGSIPTYVVLHPTPAFLGLRTLFEEQ
jgi:glucokinase